MPDVQWNSINDFSPGIQGKLSGKYPPGAAQPSSTFGCYSDNGSLSPLPLNFRQNITQTATDVTSNNQASEIRIDGLLAPGPFNKPTDVTPGYDQNDTELFVMYETYESTGSPTGRKYQLWRYLRHNFTTPTWEKCWERRMGVAYNATTRPESFMLGLTKTNPSNPAVTGQIVLVFVGNGIARMFPAPATPTTLSTDYLPGDIDDPINTPSQIVIPDNAVLHQGRVIIFDLTVPSFGPNGVQNYQNEAMHFTVVNNIHALDAGSQFGAITVGPENPSGFMVLASLTANELFLIKHTGGAVLASGDVNGIGPLAPTARTLPYVKSPGLSRNNGCLSPQGYAYPVDGGSVWLWQGGDFSKDIGQMLPLNFWQPPQVDSQGVAVTYGDKGTQCASVGQFILVPNNYIFDTETMAWWRTNDPASFIAHRWAVDYRQRKVYQACSGWKNNTDPVVKEYDTFYAASQYTWTSQPLSTTIDTTVAVKEVGIVASGTGTIAVTVTSGQDAMGATHTFTINSAVPVLVRASFHVRGSHIVFKAVSKSDDYATTALNPAPTIHEIRYGTIADTPAARG